jgi:hypothetical protein
MLKTHTACARSLGTGLLMAPLWMLGFGNALAACDPPAAPAAAQPTGHVCSHHGTEAAADPAHPHQGEAAGHHVCPHHAATAAAPAAEPAPAPAAGEAGLRVFVDPLTGKLTVPDDGELLRLAPELEEALSDSAEGLVQYAGPHGGVGVHLQGRFQSAVVATAGSGGQVTVTHDVSALAAPPETAAAPAVAMEEEGCHGHH